jgi:hypothetical protein
MNASELTVSTCLFLVVLLEHSTILNSVPGLITISTLKRQQCGTHNGRFGVRCLANEMRSVGLSGVKTYLTERLDGIVVLGLGVHFKKLIRRVCIIIILVVSIKIKISIFLKY